MRTLSCWLLLGLLITSADATSANAETIVVPDDYPHLSDACRTAMAGDVILVRPGAYLGPVPIRPGVTVTSEQGAEVTEIAMTPAEGGAVTFIDGSGGEAVLEGFTINMDEFEGIAIVSENPETVIRDNHLVGGAYSGAAIRLGRGGTILRNRLGMSQHNGIQVWGGAAYVGYNVVYPGCSGATSPDLLDAEDGVTSLTIVHNTIYSPSGTEWTFRDGTLVLFEHNILGTSFVECAGDASGVSIDYNLFFEGGGVVEPGCPIGAGNIFEQTPSFCDEAFCDLRLTPESPGADDGEGGVAMGAFGAGCGTTVGVNVLATPSSSVLSVATPARAARVSITLTLPARSDVTLHVFDALGRLVARDRVHAPAGTSRHRVPLDTPGVYFVRASSDDWSEAVRVHVVR